MAKNSNNKLLKNFKKFLKLEQYKDDFNRINISNFDNLSEMLFNELYNKSNNVPNISIKNLTTDEKNFLKKSTIINIILDDSPFIIDSITNLLSNLGYNINLIINKIIYTQRDENGVLINIDNKRFDNNFKIESLIQIHTKQISDAKKAKFIEDEIYNTLKLLNNAVSDWQSIISKLNHNIDVISNNNIIPKLEKEELINFLRWLANNNFIFLGFNEVKLNLKLKKGYFTNIKNTALGIQKNKDFDDLKKDSKEFFIFKDQPLIEVNKLVAKSPIHKYVNLDVVRVTKFDEQNNPIGEYRFIGLFTSKLFFQYTKEIPLLRQKINYIIKKADFNPNGHHAKELISILDSYPREELFQINKDELLKTALEIVQLSGRNIVKVFFREDIFNRFVSVICYVPRKNFSTGIKNRIQKILASSLKGEISSHATLINDLPYARVNYIVHTNLNKLEKTDYNDIEKQICKTAQNWTDEIENGIFENFHKNPNEIFNKYYDSFPVSYKDHFSINDAINDIKIIDILSKENNIFIDLIKPKLDSNICDLKIYSIGSQITLSNIMPTLNNFGLNVICEYTYQIKPKSNEKIWLNHFKINLDFNYKDFDNIKYYFDQAVLNCLLKKSENDYLNKLLIHAKLNFRDILIIRSLSKYIIQTNFPFGFEFIVNSIILYPDTVKKIRDLFYEKFSPQIKNRETEKISQQIESSLLKITNISHDLIFRKFLEIINNMVRTNFFIEDQKPYLSFKLLSKNISDILLPKPYAEIFVYSSDTEAIHIRGGKVARGGLRWSDRVADFRTEVHGLAKAQMTKNAIIVPVGSKGGFVVKRDLTQLSRDKFLEAGISSYKTFLSGLLDLTDNIIDNKIIKPKNIICYDEDDPYLVVAADKGTATFSDIANEISKKYNFWLGDAFASGGSNGYDHKKMGITAKGAWVSVERHFRELNININKEFFTVIGIGDMSGDVFGNGMLLSKNIQLVAAFNHLHIFIDPNPHTINSFNERKRLFNLQRSGWNDYNKKIMSKGGAIFSRSDKTLKLSSEIRKLFNIKENTITPNELIKYILKSKVDLLWNGGIGTYVKSSLESNANVGDKTNDCLRINAKELNCRIVGEGGNLGFTQLGRIEYANNKGRINTDSIDNAGGVNCSDHEVNIKITLQDLILKNQLSFQTYSNILENMTNNVEEKVLRDNYLSAQAVSIAESHNYNILDQQERLMKKLESDGLLDRKVEFLPDTEEMNKKKIRKEGLTRPELCVLLSYSKIYLYNDLLQSSLPDEEFYLKELIKYFPSELVKKYHKQVINHPLRREIISTFVANSMINRLGITFFNRVSENTGLKTCDIARGYTIIKESFHLKDLWESIENQEEKISSDIQIKMFREISNFIEGTTSWFIRTYKQPLKSIDTYITKYQNDLEKILKQIQKLISDQAKIAFNEKLAFYKNNNVDLKIAKKVAALEFMPSAYQIIHIASNSKIELNKIAKIYYNLGKTLSFRYLREKTYALNTDSYWEKLSIKTYLDFLLDQQYNLTNKIVNSHHINNKVESEIVKNWINENSKQVNRYFELLNDIKTHEYPDFSMLNVAGHRLKEISEVK